ncbi:MAG: hypothetical protein ACTSWN_17250 [Promethearchaeota archaeon]
MEITINHAQEIEAGPSFKLSDSNISVISISRNYQYYSFVWDEYNTSNGKQHIKLSFLPSSQIQKDQMINFTSNKSYELNPVFYNLHHVSSMLLANNTFWMAFVAKNVTEDIPVRYDHVYLAFSNDFGSTWSDLQILNLDVNTTKISQIFFVQIEAGTYGLFWSGLNPQLDNYNALYYKQTSDFKTWSPTYKLEENISYFYPAKKDSSTITIGFCYQINVNDSYPAFRLITGDLNNLSEGNWIEQPTLISKDIQIANFPFFIQYSDDKILVFNSGNQIYFYGTFLGQKQVSPAYDYSARVGYSNYFNSQYLGENEFIIFYQNNTAMYYTFLSIPDVTTDILTSSPYFYLILIIVIVVTVQVVIFIAYKSYRKKHLKEDSGKESKKDGKNEKDEVDHTGKSKSGKHDKDSKVKTAKKEQKRVSKDNKPIKSKSKESDEKKKKKMKNVDVAGKKKFKEKGMTLKEGTG